jgi:hypothetical protein
VGDNLAEQLYRVFCTQSGLVPGSGEVPNWASMPSSQRYVWEQVAAAARNEMHDRFVRDMRDATVAHGAEQAIENLLDAARSQ